MTDNNKLHNTYDLTTQHKTYHCGCVGRADGETLTWCNQHNRRKGTHWVDSGLSEHRL